MIEVINSKLGKISLTALAAVGAGVITIKLYYPKYDLFKIHRIPFFKKENLLIKENEDNVNIKALADLEWSSCGQSQYPGSIYRTHFSSIPCLLWIFPGGLPLGLLIVTPIKWLQSFKTKSLKNGTTEIQEERTKPDEKVNDSRTDEESLVQEKSVSQQEVEDNTVKESFLQQTSVSQKEVEDITVEESFIQQTPLSHQVVEDIAVEESFLQQTPLSHQVVEKVTVEESFLQQLPVSQQVVEEITVDEAFLQQTPLSQQVVEDITVEESFLQQTPLSHQVVEDIAVEESFLQQTSVSQQVVQNITVKESFLQQTPVSQKEVEDITVEESFLQQPPLSQQVVEDITVEESFIQQTPLSHQVVEDIAVGESFIQQTPLSHQVVEDIAVEESFLQQTPLSHQVVEKVTVEESFLQQLPVLKQVVEEVTVEESFLHQTSVSQQVVEEVTAEESFIQQTPLSHQVVEDITVEESFLQQTSVSQHVDEDFTVEESCLQQLPVSQQVVEEVTVEESFLHQTSVSQHVDEDFTVDESCLQQLPVSQQVVEDITVEESCVQETSVSQQVVEDITVDESFLQETPKKQPVVEDVVKESLLQEIEEGRTLSEHLDVSPTEKLLLQKSPKLEQLVEDFPSEKLFQEGRTQSEQVVEDCPNEELLLQKCPKTEQVLEDCFAEESFLKEKIQTEQRVEELIAGKSSLQERTETEEVVADSAARKLTSHPKVEVEKLDKSLPSAEKSSVGTKSKNKHKQRLKKLERCCSKCPSRNIHADNGEKDKYISSNSPNIPCSETNNRKSSTNTEKVVEASVSDYFTQHAKSSVVRNEPCIVKYDNQDRSSGNGKNRSKKKKGKTLFSNSIAYGQRNRDAQPNVSENRVQPLDKGTLNTPKISSSSNKVSSPFETHPKKDAEKDRGSKAYADRKMDHTTSACAKAPPNAEIKGGLEKESAFKLDDRPSCKNVKSRKESTGFYREVIDNNSTRNVPGKNENRDASHSGNNKHKKKKSYSKVLFSNSIGYGQGSNTNGATTDSKLQVPDSFPPICRQHSKQSSTLTSKSPSAHAFPKWGGSIGSVFFTNTCSIDNWIVIFHHLCMENQAIKKRIQRPDGKFLKQLEDLYNSGQFDKLKYQLMKVNKIPDFRGRVDFFGNEWNNYIRHMDLFFKNTQLSTCCSRYCPAKERYLTNSNCITWANCDISLSEEVQVWFQPEKEVSYCGQKFTSRPPQEAPIVVQSNSALCCDGRRRTHARSFKDGLPLIIPVDVELMSQIKTDLNWKDLPETIDVLNTRYQLNAATLLNETARHYTCIFRYHNEWFYYDGMVNGGNPTVFTQFPVQYRLSTCIYVRK